MATRRKNTGGARKYKEAIPFKRSRKIRRAVKSKDYAKARAYLKRSDERKRKRMENPPMKRAPKGWIRADRVRIVKRGGKIGILIQRKKKR